MALIPEAARALGMVLHELVANAAKYGALSTPEGRVSVRWQPKRQTDTAQLQVVWQESGGPPVIQPNRQGLGTRLIRDLLRHEFGGQVELNLAPAGVHCEIQLPLVRVTAPPTARLP